MLIALLAVIGVDLIVVVALLGFILARRRWVSTRPGAFRGAIRLASGDLDGLGKKWKRGYGRWVRGILVWTKGPFLFRNELVATDGLDEERPARPDEVKRVGKDPVVITVTAAVAKVQFVTSGEHRDLLLGPYAKTVSQPDERPVAAR